MSTDSKIDDYNYQNMFSSTLNSSNVTITNGTSGTTVTYPWAGTGVNTFYTTNYAYTNSRTHITENDITIDGKSLKDFMEKVEERLMIITPDLEKLEKYEALRNAYEQYKIIEALISKKEG
jgi:hypothetical protein